MSIERPSASRLALATASQGAPSRAHRDDPVRLLPASVCLDVADTPADVVDALILTAFTSGTQPFARTRRLQEIRPGAELMPAGGRLVRAAADDRRDARLAAGDGWTIRSVLWRSGPAEVTVTAVTAELAEAVLDGVLDGAAVHRSPDDGQVTIGFWHHTGRRGPSRTARAVGAQPWQEIRGNYATATAAALDRLMAITPDALAGRLLLLYGPPGTGKTTALRGLARAWKPWCDTDCVLDPEALFADPGYLMEVALGDEADADEDRRWRLLLLEDCDELIGADAKRASGQALSRLLNLTDGLLGQGRHVLVAITTNEDVRALHPAAVRPGRCLAQIEVGPLPAAQAARWLCRKDGVASAMTLADLYAERNAAAPISCARPSADVGMYL